MALCREVISDLPLLGMVLSRQPGLAAWTAPGEIDGMKPQPDPSYRHRFPAEIISLRRLAGPRV
jgi:hypothetical protein